MSLECFPLPCILKMDAFNLHLTYNNHITNIIKKQFMIFICFNHYLFQISTINRKIRQNWVKLHYQVTSFRHFLLGHIR